MTLDAWKTGSGLLDEYEMTLSEVWFGKNKQYQDGKALLFMVRGEAIVDGEVEDEEKENFYSVGDGWDTTDGGESASHASGKNTVNKNSNFGKFIDAVVGMGDEVLQAIAERGVPTEAATWEGTTWRFERKEFTYNDRKTGEKREYSVELPVEFLGVEGEEEAPKKTRGKAKAAAKPAAKKSRAKAALEPEEEDEEEAAPKKRSRRKAASSNDELRAAVVAFAAEYEDHADFMADVLDADEFDQAEEVQADEELLNDILDEEGSIWTEAQSG